MSGAVGPEGTETPSFNVLLDPWVPLAVPDANGQPGRALVSYVDLLTGAIEAEDLDHPRDDLRFFSRMLLSALTQALFPAKDARELRARIETPLSGDEVLARIEPVRGDFELLRSDGFMQTPSHEPFERSTSRMLLDSKGGGASRLFRPRLEPDQLCRPCAVPGLYGVQSFAPSGGRGYSPGVRGAPPLTTLIATASVRRSIWLNTLSLSDARAFAYAKEPPTPWRQESTSKAGETIGLVEGLFWQPRALHFALAAPGLCPLCGRHGPLVEVVAFAPKSRVAGGSFRHPFTPVREDVSPKAKKRFWSINLRPERPSWTGLLDVVAESRAAPSKRLVRLPRPAPVVWQWREHFATIPGALLVLDYLSDKASIKGRRTESLPLSLRITDPEVIDDLRRLVEMAEVCLRALGSRLKEARRKRKASTKDPFDVVQTDVASTFWQRTEPSFQVAFEKALATDVGAFEASENAARQLRVSVGEVALSLYDDHTASYEADPSVLARIALQRMRLRRDLDDLVSPERRLERELARAARQQDGLAPKASQRRRRAS